MYLKDFPTYSIGSTVDYFYGCLFSTILLNVREGNVHVYMYMYVYVQIYVYTYVHV